MAKDLKHVAATRSGIIDSVLADIQNGTTLASDVNIHWYSATVDSQATGNDVGSSTIGSSQPFTDGGTTFKKTSIASSTWTNTSGTNKTISSFSIYNGHTTTGSRAKVLYGTVGGTTGTPAWDVEITGGNVIGDNEKLKITAFTYTASQ
jgi:hypothetical protein